MVLYFVNMANTLIPEVKARPECFVEKEVEKMYWPTQNPDQNP